MPLRHILINILLGGTSFVLVQFISPFPHEYSVPYFAFALLLGLLVGLISAFFNVAKPVLVSGMAAGSLIYPYVFLLIFVVHTHLAWEWEDLSNWEQMSIYVESSLLIILVSVLPALIVLGLRKLPLKSVK